MSEWMEWERPWTRADGAYAEYEPMTSAPAVGMIVALRQRSKPYLPTFAPWFPDLIVSAVDDGGVRFENAPRLTASLDEYPVATHWAVKKAEGEGS